MGYADPCLGPALKPKTGPAVHLTVMTPAHHVVARTTTTLRHMYLYSFTLSPGRYVVTAPGTTPVTNPTAAGTVTVSAGKTTVKDFPDLCR